MRSPAFLVAIGGSAGALPALLEILAPLPADFPGAICVAVHVGSHKSVLPQLIGARTALRAAHAQQGQRLEAGRILVAPPDLHMMVEDGLVQLRHGAKVNHARPAIDPLLRSAALTWRDKAVGIILTGRLDDGSAGLAAIKACGGLAIVQDPASAMEPDMPAHALESVAADHCLPPAGIGALLQILGLRGLPAIAKTNPPRQLAWENDMDLGEESLRHLQDIGKPSSLTCPECGGSLWEIQSHGPLRYRCHTGHAFSARNLGQAQADAAEFALWSSIRALRERQMLLARMAAVSAATGDDAQAAAGRAEASRLGRQVEELMAIAQESDGGAAAGGA